MKHTIDWPRVLDDLSHLLGEGAFAFPHARQPLTSRQLATELQIARSTLVGWTQGSEPKHSDGEALLDRWCTLSGKARHHAPLERRSLKAADR